MNGQWKWAGKTWAYPTSIGLQTDECAQRQQLSRGMIWTGIAGMNFIERFTFFFGVFFFFIFFFRFYSCSAIWKVFGRTHIWCGWACAAFNCKIAWSTRWQNTQPKHNENGNQQAPLHDENDIIHLIMWHCRWYVHEPHWLQQILLSNRVLIKKYSRAYCALNWSWVTLMRFMQRCDARDLNRNGQQLGSFNCLRRHRSRVNRWQLLNLPTPDVCRCGERSKNLIHSFFFTFFLWKFGLNVASEVTLLRLCQWRWNLLE